MEFNAKGLEYPLNLYCDIAEFKEEDAARCYYYHKTADRLPPDPAETIRFLLEDYFSGRPGKELIRSVYEEGMPVPPGEDVRAVITRFFRDMLYYPRYNEILSCGTDAEALAASEAKRLAHVKAQFAGRENAFLPDLKKAGLLSEEADAVLKKHGIRDLKTICGLKKDELRFYFCGDAAGIAEAVNLLSLQNLKLFEA